MSAVDFIGMVSFSLEYSKFDNSGRPVKESIFPYYITVFQQIGANHYLVKYSGNEHYTILSTDKLTGYYWYENHTIAQVAFEERKKRKLSEG